jgi:hypothetical protein
MEIFIKKFQKNPTNYSKGGHLLLSASPIATFLGASRARLQSKGPKKQKKLLFEGQIWLAGRILSSPELQHLRFIRLIRPHNATSNVPTVKFVFQDN